MRINLLECVFHMHKWLKILAWFYLKIDMASKSIIADLNKGEKLNSENYDIWSRKI